MKFNSSIKVGLMESHLAITFSSYIKTHHIDLHENIPLDEKPINLHSFNINT